MFKRQLVRNDYFVAWANGSGLALHATGFPDSLKVEMVNDAKNILRNSKCYLILPPEDYSFGSVASPDGVSGSDLREALRWSYAKEADMDLSTCCIETLAVPGGEGQALVRASYWVFAVEQDRLKSCILLHQKLKRKVSSVDVIALAQRNLGWALALGRGVGSVATVVVGEHYSAIGVADGEGNLLFHKQFDATESGLKTDAGKERLLLELQRSLGYFERRLANVGISKGFVFGSDVEIVGEYLTKNLGGFEWQKGDYPGVSLVGFQPQIGGEVAWLVGGLLRCRNE